LYFIEHLSGTTDFCENLFGAGGPDERFGLLIVCLDVVVDRLNQLLDAVKCPASDAFVGDLSKPPLVSRGAPKPASAGRSKPASVLTMHIAHHFDSVQLPFELSVPDQDA